ncbi:MAG: ROK family protein [Sphaerochaetaceae bacterium]|nr:ROK family protein [Sphaerochaetaceae bacterium]
MSTLLLDIGGTFIKYGLSDENGRLIESSVSQQACDSSADRTSILNAFAQIKEKTRAEGRVCCCIPGPFDFSRGVCLMKQKFTSLYGFSLTEYLQGLGLEPSWIHDSTAFLLGESFDGEASSLNSCIGIMLGTGFGFAVMKDRKVLLSRTQGPLASMWNRPFGEGIVETYVSRHAIMSSYKDGKLDVKEIADRARDNDPLAQQAFRSIGRYIEEIIKAYIPRAWYDGLVIGGQISKSADLFLDSIHLDVPVKAARHPGDAALRGLAGASQVGIENCTRQYDYIDSPEKDLKELSL